jgi:hypothetical protein
MNDFLWNQSPYLIFQSCKSLWVSSEELLVQKEMIVEKRSRGSQPMAVARRITGDELRFWQRPIDNGPPVCLKNKPFSGVLWEAARE